MIAVILRGIAIAVFAACAIAQGILYWAILANHKRTASRARFFFMPWPRDEDLTRDGVIYAEWWRRATVAGLVAFLAIMATQSLP